MIQAFRFSSPVSLIFGNGKFRELPSIIKNYGGPLLLLTGGSSFKKSEHFTLLTEELKELKIEYFHESIAGEPESTIIDGLTAKYRPLKIALVISIGGGSVLDGGKAISAMLTTEGSIEDYLEGVGTKKPTGTKRPFIAVPTTAGTGSEATKNAVISKVGKGGYKKSLRHDNFVPDLALIDPTLHLSCPFSISTACAMDALTQLIESYVSTKASAITDSLVEGALEAMARAFSKLKIDKNALTDIEVRADLAYASHISGITLANAGLGPVHGFASSLGGLYHIPHGALCGTLLAPVTRVIIERLRGAERPGHSLEKYAKAGAILSQKTIGDVKEGCDRLISLLEEYSKLFEMPPLSNYGVERESLAHIAELTGNKNSPITLTNSELEKVLLERI